MPKMKQLIHKEVIMLYTARPLERIYANPEVFRSDNRIKDRENVQPNSPEYEEVILPNGRITTRREGKKQVIERVNSTNMKDYLNKAYAPGANYEIKG